MSLIGREHEASALLKRLFEPACRLLTVTGPGGIGKTSLALHAAGLAADRGESRFADGVAVVYLAALTTGGEVRLAIADALNEPLQGTHPALEQLVDALRQRSLLLVLDNADQLVGDGAFVELIGRLLREAAGVTLLATSRERLRVRGEQVIELGGLTVPPTDHDPLAEQAEAVQLFLYHARRGDPAFATDARSRAAIVAICRRLGGSPLAIELAAAWTGTLSAEEIAAELDRALDSLTRAGRDMPARHRSMRAVLDRSWALLDAEQRRALARCSVFQGGFTHQAAADVAGATLPILTALIDKSLLRRTELRATTRYALHELVGQYAAEQLTGDEDDLAATEARHAAYYAELLQRTIPTGTGAATVEARSSLNHEIENLRAAWARAAAHGDLHTLGAMVRGLWVLYEANSWLLDGAALFATAAGALSSVAVPGATGLRGYLLVQQGAFLARAGRFDLADPLIAEGMELVQADGTAGTTDLTLHLAMIELRRARIGSAETLLGDVAAAARPTGDDWVQLWAELFLAWLARFRGDYAAAEHGYRRCLANWHGQNFARGEALALAYLGDLERIVGRLDTAAAHLETSTRVASLAGDRWSLGIAFGILGALAYERSEWDQAQYFLTESVALARELGEYWTLGAVLCYLGHLARTRGALRDALQCYAEVARIVAGGETILLGDLVWGLALLSERQGDDQTALALLLALETVAAEHDTVHRAARLRPAVEARLRPEQAAAAAAISRQPLLPWLTRLASPAPAAPPPRQSIGQPGGLFVPDTGETLSPREVEVLRLLLAGATNPTIADTLVISRFTVKNHVASILGKLGVTTRTQAAQRGRALGLEPLAPR